MARKTAADVHLELSVHQKESAERWKTAFNKFVDIELELKELQQKQIQRLLLKGGSLENCSKTYFKRGLTRKFFKDLF